MFKNCLKKSVTNIFDKKLDKIRKGLIESTVYSPVNDVLSWDLHFLLQVGVYWKTKRLLCLNEN